MDDAVEWLRSSDVTRDDLDEPMIQTLANVAGIPMPRGQTLPTQRNRSPKTRLSGSVRMPPTQQIWMNPPWRACLVQFGWYTFIEGETWPFSEEEGRGRGCGMDSQERREARGPRRSDDAGCRCREVQSHRTTRRRLRKPLAFSWNEKE
jgi:hypothetical protein